MSNSPYDHRNCQSLFGYAAKVHARSGGVCQLCDCGADRIDFDLWRQMTVEHLIGSSQGGYLEQIRVALAARFPDVAPPRLDELAHQIDAYNTVTACSFCNSTTSRNRAPRAMDDLIANTPGGPEDVSAAVQAELQTILSAKRREVAWKLTSVREAFEQCVKPRLKTSRAHDGGPRSSGGGHRE